MLGSMLWMRVSFIQVSMSPCESQRQCWWARARRLHWFPHGWMASTARAPTNGGSGQGGVQRSDTQAPAVQPAGHLAAAAPSLGGWSSGCVPCSKVPCWGARGQLLGTPAAGACTCTSHLAGWLLLRHRGLSSVIRPRRARKSGVHDGRLPGWALAQRRPRQWGGQQPTCRRREGADRSAGRPGGVAGAQGARRWLTCYAPDRRARALKLQHRALARRPVLPPTTTTLPSCKPLQGQRSDGLQVLCCQTRDNARR
jgi:hypothetical protein